jgi:hypothetical protein
MTLIAHCGAQHRTLQELETMPLPPPMGRRHVVRPFAEDVHLIKGYVAMNHGVVNEEAFAVVFDKYELPTRFFGLMSVGFRDLVTDDTYDLLIGLRGSYDQSLPRGLAVGSRVLVCDNLAFSGEIVVKTKQTTFLEHRIGDMWKTAVAQIPKMAEHQHGRFEAYRDRELKKGEADTALIDLCRLGTISPSNLGHVLSEWDCPTHDEHGLYGNTVWRMYNAVTEGIKPASDMRMNVSNVWDKTQRMTEYFDRLVA